MMIEVVKLYEIQWNDDELTANISSKNLDAFGVCTVICASDDDESCECGSCFWYMSDSGEENIRAD